MLLICLIYNITQVFYSFQVYSIQTFLSFCIINFMSPNFIQLIMQILHYIVPCIFFLFLLSTLRTLWKLLNMSQRITSIIQDPLQFLIFVLQELLILIKVFVVGIFKIFITFLTVYFLVLLVAPIVILVLFEVFYIQTLVFIYIPTKGGFFYLVFWYGWGVFVILLVFYVIMVTIKLLQYTPFWIWDQNFFDSYTKYLYFIYFWLFFLILHQYALPYWRWYLPVRKVMFAYIEVLHVIEYSFSLVILIIIFVDHFILAKYHKDVNYYYPFKKYEPYHYYNPYGDDFTFFMAGNFYIKPPEDVSVEIQVDENGTYYFYFEQTITNNLGEEHTDEFWFELPKSLVSMSDTELADKLALLSNMDIYELNYLENKDLGGWNPEISDAEICYILYDETLWDFMERVDKCNLGDPGRSKKIREAIHHYKCSLFFFPKGRPIYFTPFHKLKVYVWLYYGLIFGFKNR